MELVSIKQPLNPKPLGRDHLEELEKQTKQPWQSYETRVELKSPSISFQRISASFYDVSNVRIIIAILINIFNLFSNGTIKEDKVIIQKEKRSFSTYTYSTYFKTPMELSSKPTMMISFNKDPLTSRIICSVIFLTLVINPVSSIPTPPPSPTAYPTRFNNEAVPFYQVINNGDPREKHVFSELNLCSNTDPDVLPMCTNECEPFKLRFIKSNGEWVLNAKSSLFAVTSSELDDYGDTLLCKNNYSGFSCMDYAMSGGFVVCLSDFSYTEVDLNCGSVSFCTCGLYDLFLTLYVSNEGEFHPYLGESRTIHACYEKAEIEDTKKRGVIVSNFYFEELERIACSDYRVDSEEVLVKVSREEPSDTIIILSFSGVFDSYVYNTTSFTYQLPKEASREGTTVQITVVSGTDIVSTCVVEVKGSDKCEGLKWYNVDWDCMSTWYRALYLMALISIGLASLALLVCLITASLNWIICFGKCMSPGNLSRIPAVSKTKSLFAWLFSFFCTARAEDTSEILTSVFSGIAMVLVLLAIVVAIVIALLDRKKTKTIKVRSDEGEWSTMTEEEDSHYSFLSIFGSNTKKKDSEYEVMTYRPSLSKKTFSGFALTCSLYVLLGLIIGASCTCNVNSIITNSQSVCQNYSNGTISCSVDTEGQVEFDYVKSSVCFVGSGGSFEIDLELSAMLLYVPLTLQYYSSEIIYNMQNGQDCDTGYGLAQCESFSGLNCDPSNSPSSFSFIDQPNSNCECKSSFGGNDCIATYSKVFGSINPILTDRYAIALGQSATPIYYLTAKVTDSNGEKDCSFTLSELNGFKETSCGITLTKADIASYPISDLYVLIKNYPYFSSEDMFYSSVTNSVNKPETCGNGMFQGSFFNFTLTDGLTSYYKEYCTGTGVSSTTDSNPSIVWNCCSGDKLTEDFPFTNSDGTFNPRYYESYSTQPVITLTSNKFERNMVFEIDFNGNFSYAVKNSVVIPKSSEDSYDLTGCYSCDSGATFQGQFYSDGFEGTASISCNNCDVINPVVYLDLDEATYEINVKCQKQSVDDTCYISAGKLEDSFKISGKLSAPISKTVGNITNTEFTPNLGNHSSKSFDSQSTWEKIVFIFSIIILGLIVLCILALAFYCLVKALMVPVKKMM